MAKSPIRVTLFWNKGPLPNMVWEKCFSTAKLAIVAKDNIQVDKLLKPKPGKKVEHPHEPMYEPLTAVETTAERRQHEHRNIKRKVDWQIQCLAIEDKDPYVDIMPWMKPTLKLKASSTGPRGYKYIPSEQPQHGDVQMHHRCICRTIKGNIQRGQKQNVWQISILQL